MKLSAENLRSLAAILMYFETIDGQGTNLPVDVERFRFNGHVIDVDRFGGDIEYYVTDIREGDEV